MMYVFGGYNDGNCHNDIHAFDLIRHHWLHIETSNGISPGTSCTQCVFSGGFCALFSRHRLSF
jgi:hypothetical protein